MWPWEDHKLHGQSTHLKILGGCWSPAMEGTVLVVGGTALMFIIGAGKEMGGLRAAVARYFRPG